MNLVTTIQDVPANFHYTVTTKNYFRSSRNSSINWHGKTEIDRLKELEEMERRGGKSLKRRMKME
jgi:hypothetical protein